MTDETQSYNFDAPRLRGDLSEMADSMDDGADQWFDNHVDDAAPQVRAAALLDGQESDDERIASEDACDDTSLDAPSTASSITPRRADRTRRRTPHGNAASKENTEPLVHRTRASVKAPSSSVMAGTASSRLRAQAIRDTKAGNAKAKAVTVTKQRELTVPVTPEVMRRSQRAAGRRHTQPETREASKAVQLRTHAPNANKELKLTVPITPEFMRRENKKPRKASTLVPQEAPPRAKAKAKAGGDARALTVPVSPAFSRRSAKDRAPPMSSEEIELRMIEKERVRREQERQNTIKFRSELSMISKRYMPVRSNKPLTEPTEFSFQQRQHKMAMRRRTIERRMESLTNQTHLRHYTPAKGKVVTTSALTQTKPFKFHTTARTKQSDDAAKAPASKTFEASLRSARSTTASLHTTVPKSPKLTKPQPRNQTVKSSAEREDEMMQQIQPFKAKPVNHTIMASRGQYGVPKIPKKVLTEPQEFTFISESRLRNDPSDAAGEEYAKPAPRSTTASLTVPQSPALRTRSRARPAPPVEEEVHVTFQANPMPEYDDMCGLQPVERKELTRPEPFSFDAKDQRRRVEHAQLVERAHAEELDRTRTCFVANSLPSDSPDQLPRQNKRKRTEPQEFNLESVKRSEAKQQDIKDKMEQEQQEEQAARVFRARPCTVTEEAPFSTRSSAKPLTEIEAFQMSSESRGNQRALYDAERKEREATMEHEKAQAQAEMARQEEIEVRDMRARRTFRATGIPNYKTLAIQPSSKTLTEPRTPNFSQRSMARRMR